MSLEQWLEWGYLTEHRSSRQEIGDLLSGADRDIANAEISEISDDWRLNIAHNAILRLAAAALAACGYRPERQAHHYRLIQSLEKTVGLDTTTIDRLHLLHKKRNIASYQIAGAVSEKEACEILAIALEIRDIVHERMRRKHPEFLAD